MEPINLQNQVAKKVKKLDIKKNMPLVGGALVVVLLGVFTASVLANKLLGKQNSTESAPGVKVTSTEAGLLDSNTKYDEATGDLKAGGIGNEGTHHIERDGGPSRYVYLTSSVIDLESFVGKKVQVWGQTIASKKAGWLMDVSKVKVSE